MTCKTLPIPGDDQGRKDHFDNEYLNIEHTSSIRDGRDPQTGRRDTKTSITRLGYQHDR